VELIAEGRLLFRESMWLWNLDGGELREEAGTKGFGAWVPESWPFLCSFAASNWREEVTPCDLYRMTRLDSRLW